VVAPVVIIEVAAPGSSPSGLAALVRACDEAISEGRCVISHPGKDPPEPEAVAIVSWVGNNRVRVEVGVRRDPSSEWRVREVGFGARDSMVDRWRAAGLVIATLVGELHVARSTDSTNTDSNPPPPAEVPREPPPAAPPAHRSTPVPNLEPPVPALPPPAPPVNRPVERPKKPNRVDTEAPALPTNGPPESVWLQGGVSSAPAWQGRTWRSGFWAAGAARIGSTPMLLGLGADYSWTHLDDRGVSGQWFSLAAGVAVDVNGPADLAFGARVEGMAERLSVESVNRFGAKDSGATWTPGVRAAAYLMWPGTGPIAPLVGLEWWLLESGTTVRVAGVDMDRSPPSGIRALAGVCLRLR
jgi:hypothetical protein